VIREKERRGTEDRTADSPSGLSGLARELRFTKPLLGRLHAPTLLHRLALAYRHHRCRCHHSDSPCFTAELSELTKRLSPRWFLMRNVHSQHGIQLNRAGRFCYCAAQLQPLTKTLQLRGSFRR